MLGCELRDNDEWTLSLITNTEVLRVLKHSSEGKQIYRREDKIVWAAKDDDGSYYIALFNTGEEKSLFEVELSDMNLRGGYTVRDLWEHQDLKDVSEKFQLEVNSHGTRLIKLK